MVPDASTTRQDKHAITHFCMINRPFILPVCSVQVTFSAYGICAENRFILIGLHMAQLNSRPNPPTFNQNRHYPGKNIRRKMNRSGKNQLTPDTNTINQTFSLQTLFHFMRFRTVRRIVRPCRSSNRSGLNFTKYK